MCFAIIIGNHWSATKFEFQFPFRRDVLCNPPGGQILIPYPICFNSLFVGMCFAIMKNAVRSPVRKVFQFPFRRDVLCNPASPTPWRSAIPVSIPFSSGCALQCKKTLMGAKYEIGFNSLFVGMCFAIVRCLVDARHEEMFQFPFRRDVLCNQMPRSGSSPPKSVSIPFSSGCALQYLLAVCMVVCPLMFQFPFRRDVLCNPELGRFQTWSNCRFNSLFVGMCFAIVPQAVRDGALGDVSIPFSSGCALQ